MNVVPASQVRSTLLLMERPADERVTAAVAHDLCQRMGVRATLMGSIAPLGGAYVIGLEAQACPTGEIIAREQVQAPSKTDVLASVGAAAARIREKLGESIGSIQRFNVPIQDATTPSLEALKAYSLGVHTRTTIGDVQAIPFFEHALELDPNFAVAAARLASIYTNLRDISQAQNYMQRAFARSDSLSEPERLFIKSNYDYIVTGKLDEVVGTYRLWISTYPHDWIPHNNLSTTYQRLGQADASLQEAREAVRLAPTSVVPYQQLARALLALDRFDECKAILQDAANRGLDSSYNRHLLFDIAFLNNDPAGMMEHLRAAASRADSYLVLTEAARAALASGEIDTSRTLYAQAVSAARTAHFEDFAGSLVAEQALADALQNDGNRAQQELDAALRISSGIDTTWTSALAAAFSGRAPLAAQLAERYRQSAPPAADVTQAFAPVLQAAVALAKNDGRRALDMLASGSPYERAVGPWLPYLRGLGHTLVKDHAAAASQFRDIIKNRGNQPTNLLHTLARLQLARTLRAQGQFSEARQAYADFTGRLRNGDPRHPLLISAKREAAALPIQRR
jgi:tetratricopeptide (TPR) repeat protein